MSAVFMAINEMFGRSAAEAEASDHRPLSVRNRRRLSRASAAGSALRVDGVVGVRASWLVWLPAATES